MATGRHAGSLRKAAAMAAAAAACAGCRWIPARHPRPDPVADRPTAVAPVPGDVATLPALPSLRSIGDAEAFSPPAPTPLLDAAAARDAEIKRAIASDLPASPPAEGRDVVLAAYQTSDRADATDSGVKAGPQPEPAISLPVEPAEPPPAPASDRDALWDYVLSALADASESVAAKVEPPQQAAPAPVVEPAPVAPALAITEMRICRRVLGFGRTEPPADPLCRPGQSLLLYCEVEGLRDEEVAGEFRSRFASSLAIRPASGGDPVWSQDIGTAEDRCGKRRRDFFVNYRVTLPASLPAGDYAVVLVQKDLLAGSEATRSAGFTVVTPAR